MIRALQHPGIDECQPEALGMLVMATARHLLAERVCPTQSFNYGCYHYSQVILEAIMSLKPAVGLSTGSSRSLKFTKKIRLA